MCVFVIFKVGANYGYDTCPKAVNNKVSSEEEVVSSMIRTARL